MSKGLFFGTVLAACITFPLTADAVNTLTFTFNAHVTVVDDPDNLLGGAISVGDTFKGTFAYDLDTPDTNPDPTVGDYWHSTAPHGFKITINNLVFNTDPDNTEFLFELVNRDPSQGGDAIVLRSYQNDFSIPMQEEHISWQLDDPDGTALSDVNLPTSFDLSLWEQMFGLTITGENMFPPLHSHYFIRAVVDKVTPVQPAWGTASQVQTATRGTKEVGTSEALSLLVLLLVPFTTVLVLKGIRRRA